MKEAKKVQITDQICRQAQLMRRGGANQVQVAQLLGINSSTVSRIEAAGFDLKAYTEKRRAQREKEKKRAEEPKAEEQVPGQIRMELPEKPEMSDQTKLMRFQAGQIDKVVEAVNALYEMEQTKLGQIYDAVSMLLRAVRKE